MAAIRCPMSTCLPAVSVPFFQKARHTAAAGHRVVLLVSAPDLNYKWLRGETVRRHCGRELFEVPPGGLAWGHAAGWPVTKTELESSSTPAPAKWI